GNRGTPKNVERKKSALARTFQRDSLNFGFRSYQSGRKGHGASIRQQIRIALLKIPSFGGVARSDSGPEAPGWVGFHSRKPPLSPPLSKGGHRRRKAA